MTYIPVYIVAGAFASATVIGQASADSLRLYLPEVFRVEIDLFDVDSINTGIYRGRVMGGSIGSVFILGHTIANIISDNSVAIGQFFGEILHAADVERLLITCVVPNAPPAAMPCLGHKYPDDRSWYGSHPASHMNGNKVAPGMFQWACFISDRSMN